MADRPKGTIDFSDNDKDLLSKVKSRTEVPVGGAPMPKVPRLDQAPANKHVGVQNASAARRLLTPEEHKKLVESGKLVQGVGSGYAANQPGLAALPTDEEGRPQEVHPDLMPRPEGAGLRPDTLKGLEKLAEANTSSKKEDKELEKIEEELDELDDEYITDEFGNRVRSMLANKKRREAIENRCMPMDIDDLLMKGSVEQRIPIVPGKFEPTFRSPQGHEDTFLNERMSKVRGSDRMIMDLHALFRLTCGLVKINNRTLPNHLGQNGKPTDDLFDAKFAMVSSLATPVLADLSTNYTWFLRRVEKLLVFDNIKDF